MIRDVILAKLKARQTRLREIGVVSASLFGSVARGEDTSTSDIDVAVRLDPERVPHGLAYVAFLDELEAELSAALERPVEIVPEPVRKPRLQQQIDRDRAVAF